MGRLHLRYEDNDFQQNVTREKNQNQGKRPVTRRRETVKKREKVGKSEGVGDSDQCHSGIVPGRRAPANGENQLRSTTLSDDFKHLERVHCSFNFRVSMTVFLLL